MNTERERYEYRKRKMSVKKDMNTKIQKEKDEYRQRKIWIQKDGKERYTKRKI